MNLFQNPGKKTPGRKYLRLNWEKTLEGTIL